MAERFTRTADGGRLVPLVKPLTTHGAPIKAIALRAPLWPDYMAVGEIHIPARSGETVALVDDDAAIQGYAERLMQPDALEFRSQIGLADAIAIKEAIRDFFEQARSDSPA